MPQKQNSQNTKHQKTHEIKTEHKTQGAGGGARAKVDEATCTREPGQTGVRDTKTKPYSVSHLFLRSPAHPHLPTPLSGSEGASTPLHHPRGESIHVELAD